ncbi:peroxidase family protein [Roseobacter sp. AzwK-3b]|uniref:peroxidase family protein n=1 Tax=Roseobacter sp. AzwK-3b TaxID=351016 RepID=UPI0002E10F4C|nr:peroxidase family protein [Roseobacter sp. AzwK-3b]
MAQLGVAEGELATLNTNLGNADAEVTRLEGVVQTETTDLETAAGGVTTAQQNLAAAQMADAAILAQLDVIADATVTLTEATATAAQAALDLTAAEGVEATKQVAVDTATSDLNALTAPGAAEAALAAAQATAAEAQTTLDTLLTTHNITMDGNNVLLPDVTPDEGLSAPYNSWMTLFGQFFDHGLDLVGKGGSGTVYIPLQPDDPLYDANSPTNFMVLTRATNQPGPDGILGTADDIREHFNKTTPWVDQNQTYTSHPSHQVFLREYDIDANGNPVSNGYLLHGQTGGMATWGDVKAQAATKLGIQLNDSDVLDGPLLATDPYGNFIPGANGLPQLVVPNPAYVEGGTEPLNILIEGDLANPVDASQALRNGHAFLEDISHTAFPKGMIDHDRNPMTPEIEVLPDADTDTGNAIMPNIFGMNETYDNELLDRHFIAGDGRGNENFGLTAVHHVFHTEHNRQAAEMKQTILDSGELAFINEWLATPITEADLATATVDTVEWDGGRLFQAAKFTTEMQYQHLAFEEFGRTVQPQIAAFGVNGSAEIDCAVMADSPMWCTASPLDADRDVHTMDPNGVNTSNGLIEAFLNPVAFDLDQTLTSDQAAGAVARGMSRETGANIDEFITSALRDNLVGLPLDLAALNIARGRETGVPSLNAAREQFYSATGSEFLKPYEGWSEFAANLKNPASIINFIASYGTHETIVNATTVVEKRAAATDLVLGGDNAPADRLDFVNGTGAWADAETGINDVEFWIGGLAEDIMPFGGMLGSSFGFVFQQQMEALQNGDRFYYLARTAGMNMIAELENNSFASMIVRNTDIKDGGAHIPANIFSSMDVILEVDQAVQSMPDPVSTDVDPFLAAMGTTMVERATATVDAPLIDGVREYDNFLKFNGGEHAVLGGTDQRDILNGGLGDDALWGGAGDDLLIGDAGVNTLRGGAGNDILKDGDDVSFLHGEDGDDVISAGGGIGELMFGGKGNDAILMGSDDAATAFGMDGNDFIYGGAGGEFMFGGEGDDWIEGGDGFDMVMGDNGDPFGGSRVVGHDVLDGGANDNDLLGEGGDDILIQREGVHVNEGDLGFDWVAHKDAMTGADIDLSRRLETNETQAALRDRYDLVEAASGTQFDDFLYGDDREGAALPDGIDLLANDATLFANELTQAGVDRIAGLRELLADMMGVDPADTFTGGNILLGGGGSDVIQGRGGDDVIDGDKALNVRISVRDPQDPTVELRSINSLFEISNELLDGSISPGQLQIVREILDAGQEGDVDTAVYFDVRANYNIRTNADGSVTVDHIAPPIEGAFIDPINGQPNVEGGDGTDRLTNVEILRFADMEIDLRTDPASNGLIQGTDGDDVLNGSNGRDAIFAGAGNDVINGLAGNDVIFGEGGSDTITWNAPNGGYDVVVGHGIVNDGGTDMLVINGDGTEDGFTMYTVAAWTGQAPVDPSSEIIITRTVAGVETAIMEVRGIEEVAINGVQGIETINAVGDFAGTSLAPNTIYVNGTAGREVIDFSGFTSTQRLVVDAGDGRDVITGGAGNDILNAGAGDDEITWSVGGGSDVVDGGAGEDTYTINGDASDETFRVYAADSWTGAPLATGTDIVITRDAGAGEQVIGQLQNIEEIQINTAGGVDNVEVIGDFNPTALNFNTIAVTGDDVSVDVTQRLSTHRVFVDVGGNTQDVPKSLNVAGVVTEGDVFLIPVDPTTLTRTVDVSR